MNHRHPNPYFISRHHLDAIRSRSVSCQPRPTATAAAIEERYRNYVRDASHQMTRHWTNSVQSLSRQHVADTENRQRQRTVDDQQAYEAMRDQQRRDQRAQIADIEAKMRRARPGPKLLDSATLLANCLRVQQQQRHEMALKNISNRQQVAQEGRLLRLQNQQWHMEQQHRQQEHQLRAMHYKQELRGMMEERHRQRQLELFHRQCPPPDDSFPRNCEKERREMERRQLRQRATATEAMRMAEQRRLREKITAQVEDKLCAIYAEGKERQQALRLEQQQQVAEEQKIRVEVGREKIAKILEAVDEREREQEAIVVANAAEEYRQRLTAKEQAEVERKRRLKVQRIQFYLEAQQAAKQKKMAENAAAKEAIMVRLENEEVTREFEGAQRERRAKEAVELRRKLFAQTDEKVATDKAIKEGVQLFTNRHCDFSEDHRDFVRCAKEALVRAKAEQLPVQPLVKAINAYEKEHFVEEKRLLPHLEVRQPPVVYERPALPEGNSKEIIRYNIEQLRSLNPVGMA